MGSYWIGRNRAPRAETYDRRRILDEVGGYPGRYDSRAKKIILNTKPSLFVCGHSHILKVMRDLNLNLIHMNPGACGNAGWHQVRTGLRFTVTAGKVDGVEAIELGKRGR